MNRIIDPNADHHRGRKRFANLQRDIEQPQEPKAKNHHQADRNDINQARDPRAKHERRQQKDRAQRGHQTRQLPGNHQFAQPVQHIAIAGNPDSKAAVRFPAHDRGFNARQPAAKPHRQRIVRCGLGLPILAKLADRKVADNLHHPCDIPGTIRAQIHRHVGMLVVIVHDIIEIIRITGERVQQQILGDQILGGRDDFHLGAILIHDPIHTFDIFRQRQGAAHIRILLH